MIREKKDERGKGSVVLKTGNQINASFMGTRSRSRVALETSQQLQASESQGRKRGVANTNDTNIALVKPELRLLLWYSVTSVKISSTQSVLVGMMRS